MFIVLYVEKITYSKGPKVVGPFGLLDCPASNQ